MMMKRALLGLVAVAAVAASSQGESTDIDSVTLGAMTERADVVVVAEAAAGGTVVEGRQGWGFRVVDTLRSSSPIADLRLIPRGSLASGPPANVVRPGAQYLLFLRSLGGGDFEPVAVPWGERDASDPAVRPLVEYTRRYAAALSKDGKVARPDDLAALLVESIASPSGGVPASAGRDLVRHDELVAALTPAQRQAIDEAVAKPRKADLDLASIVDAAGVAGTAASNDALVAWLVDPAAHGLRLNVTGALRRHASDALVSSLGKRLAGATPQQRADVVNALGRLDLRSAEPHLVKALGDAAPEVRIEAAHSLGLLARAVREPRPGVGPDVPREKLGSAMGDILGAVKRATTPAEKRALVWALAQIDTDDAWTALRALRDESADERVRDLATQYLLRPRVELILE